MMNYFINTMPNSNEDNIINKIIYKLYKDNYIDSLEYINGLYNEI